MDISRPSSALLTNYFSYMISSPQILNDDELIEKGGKEEVAFGYIKLFDHFLFSKEERQNPDKIEKVKYIWNGLIILANRDEITPMHKLSNIELGLGQELYVEKLTKVYHYIQLSMQKIDIDAELKSL